MGRPYYDTPGFRAELFFGAQTVSVYALDRITNCKVGIAPD